MKQPQKKPILFVDILTGDPADRRRLEKLMYGGKPYAERIRHAAKLKPKELRWIDASKERFPDPRRYRTIIIGGSTMNPTKAREDRWVEATFSFIRRAKRAGTPILGICGGLQFTVRALGGRIVMNPRGRDFGNAAIALTVRGRRDYLFAGLPKTITVQESHRCVAASLPRGWVPLAHSKKTALEAIAIGDRIRLVQFHPEMTVTEMRTLGRARRAALVAEGVMPKRQASSFLRSIRDTRKAGTRMMRNFIERHDS